MCKNCIMLRVHVASIREVKNLLNCLLLLISIFFLILSYSDEILLDQSRLNTTCELFC